MTDTEGQSVSPGVHTASCSFPNITGAWDLRQILTVCQQQGKCFHEQAQILSSEGGSAMVHAATGAGSDSGHLLIPACPNEGNDVMQGLEE